jgi:aldehyde:ferredoxin oxidoreductase
LPSWRKLVTSLTLRPFEAPPFPLRVGWPKAATGSNRRAADLIPMGKGIVAFKRRSDSRLGLCSADDRLPERRLRPWESGGAAGHVPGIPALLAGVYAESGWDPDSGRPPEAPDC